MLRLDQAPAWALGIYLGVVVVGLIVVARFDLEASTASVDDNPVDAEEA